MGLSSSKSTSKIDQKTTGTETTSGTTTPQLPSYLGDVTQDFFGRIGALGDMDPNSFIAPASPLQQMAWQNAPTALSGWQGQASTAANLLNNIATQGSAPKGTGGGLQGPPSTIMTPQQATASTYQAPQLGPAPLATGQGYTAPQLGSPALVSGQGYSAPQLGAAQGYAAARAGAPIGQAAQVAPTSTVNPYGFNLQGGRGYTPTGIGQTQIAGTPGATASNATAGNIAGNMAQFQNPYEQQVINAGLAQQDQSIAEAGARLSAQGAKAGAFGGSRFGIAQGELGAQGARDRAMLEASLRAQGFNTAAQLGGQQAGMDQSASQFNAGNRTGVSLANAAQEAARAQAQAGLTQNANLFNAQGQTDASRYVTEQNNANSRLNQQAQLGLASQNMAAQNARAAQQAGLSQQMGLANLDTQGRFALDNAGRQDAAGQFGATAGNQFALAQGGMNQQAGQFNAANAQQAGLANQAAANQFGLAQGGFNQAAGQFNAANAQQAGLANQAMQGQFGLAGAGLQADAGQFNAAGQNAASQFNAGQANQMGMFGAGLQGEQQARALQAALGLQQGAGQFADNTRQDLGTMAALGEQQRGIEQGYALAPLAQLQAMGQLGQFPFQSLVGQQIAGTSNTAGTQVGTNTTTQSPSLFNQLLAAGQVAATAFSDRALKRDIEHAGTLASGLNLYRYRYDWDEPERPLRLGVMADEVEDFAPHALGPVVAGFRMVDYGRLGLAHLVEA